jgi:hypothetical protein
MAVLQELAAGGAAREVAPRAKRERKPSTPAVPAHTPAVVGVFQDESHAPARVRKVSVPVGPASPAPAPAASLPRSRGFWGSLLGDGEM